MDESQLQVTPKDGNSSLSLSKVRSGLIGRGLSDVAILAGPSSSATLEQRLADLKPMDMLSECRRLAEEGDADAQWELAIAYYTGDLFEHVLQDNAEAVNRDDPGFIESNLMHSMNGFVYGNLPGMELKDWAGFERSTLRPETGCSSVYSGSLEFLNVLGVNGMLVGSKMRGAAKNCPESRFELSALTH